MGESMTHDEIRAEFEAWAKRARLSIEKSVGGDYLSFHTHISYSAYLAAAEPREKRIAELERERNEARAFGEKAAKLYNELLADQRVLTCAFCGQAYPPDTPPTQHDALTAHVAVCPAHPMRNVEASLARLGEAFERLWTEYEKDPQRKRNGPEAVAIEDIRAALAEQIECAHMDMPGTCPMVEQEQEGKE
jgi:hypothetical protein